jgi:nucleotide-binding universal stress UspA family protein
LTIRRILVAVDGSKPAEYAIDKAIDFAKKYGAELSALYVISLNIPLNELEGVAKKTGQKHLDKLKRKAAKKNLKVKTEIVVGITSTVKEIVEYAEKKKIDLIITGSRGMTGFKKMLLGSVASGVVTYAHCPVLVVK